MDADYLLVRRGIGWESAQRLGKLAAAAEQSGFGYGVSLTTPAMNAILAADAQDAVMALKSAFEKAGFKVLQTPTRRDPEHHTVLLPKPVTPPVVKAFNGVLNRTRA